MGRIAERVKAGEDVQRDRRVYRDGIRRRDAEELGEGAVYKYEIIGYVKNIFNTLQYEVGDEGYGLAGNAKVAASAASGGAAPFLAPFLLLCALSLAALAGAPFAAAAALRLTRE